MLKYITNLTNKIKLPGNEITKLGRWEHRINDKQKNIKFIYNNSDHCGDIICGDPKLVQNILGKNNKKIDKINRIN